MIKTGCDARRPLPLQVYISLDDEYVLGEINSRVTSLTDGKYKSSLVITRNKNKDWKAIRFTHLVNEIDGGPTLVFSPSEIVKCGAKVSFTINESNFIPDSRLLSNEVSKDEKLFATVVNTNIFGHSSIIMLDDNKYGYLLKDMGQSVRDEIAKLNIPNVDKRRFICSSNTNLHFHKNSLDSKTRTKENTMSNKIVEMVKGDAKEAAYRVAGTQITNGVKVGVVKLFESKGGKSEHMTMLKEVLDSEVGDSLIALLLGFGLNYAPGLKDDPRIQKLSEEFRINGMAVAGNAIVGAAMESFLPVLTGALQALPAEEASKPRIVESSEEEEEEVVAPPARRSKSAGG
jgi:hypothetical protein